MIPTPETTDEPLPLKPEEELDRGLDTQPEEEAPEAYEPTYRDGSAQNECWRQE